MQTFTGFEYLLIDIGSNAGLDKESWDDRIQWTKSNMNKLEDLTPESPKTKFLYKKAVKALRDIKNPTGFIMSLDSTASGIQVMAALGKCAESAKTCNLIDTGTRQDLYTNIMNQITNPNITRQQVKEATIPLMYGSKAAPKELFGEGTKELEAYLYAVECTVPILGQMKALADYCWNPTSKYHQFTMPDGHVVRLPTLVLNYERIEVFKTSFTYQWKAVGTSEDSTSLLSAIVHSTDAYIAREMVRKCDFEMAHIHDSFWTSPNNFNRVREVYKDILIEIAKSDLLKNIMEELTGKPIELKFTDPDLWKQMNTAEYMLS